MFRKCAVGNTDCSEGDIWGILVGSNRKNRSEAHDGSEEKEASVRTWIRGHSCSILAMNLPIFVCSDFMEY